MKNFYDIIICGGGITGLLLAKKITDDIYFKNHKIALIEKEDKIKMTEPLVFGKKVKENGIVLFAVAGTMQILFQMNMSHLLN